MKKYITGNIFENKISYTYITNWIARRFIREKKHIVALLLKIWKKDIFCNSLEQLNNAVFGKEVALGRKLT